MAKVSIRDLRNRGGEVVDRARAGEPITITRSGKPVAELRAAARRPLAPRALVDAWAKLPDVDPESLRSDLDRTVDPSL